MAAIAARVARRAMKKFICIAHSNSSSLVPRKPSSRSRTAPTLLTSTSTRPCSSSARSMSRAGPSVAMRSTATAVTPSRPSSVSVVREPATTCAPSCTRAWVIARPIPLPAPVTTATLPFSSRSMGATLATRSDGRLRGCRGSSSSSPSWCRPGASHSWCCSSSSTRRPSGSPPGARRREFSARLDGRLRGDYDDDDRDRPQRRRCHPARHRGGGLRRRRGGDRRALRRRRAVRRPRRAGAVPRGRRVPRPVAAGGLERRPPARHGAAAPQGALAALPRARCTRSSPPTGCAT